GSGDQPVDAGDFGGSFPSGTLAFEAGETSKLLTLGVSDMIEAGKEFAIVLSDSGSPGTLARAAVHRDGTVVASIFGVTGQSYSTATSTYVEGALVASRFDGVMGQQCSSFQYDYDHGSFAGARYFYSGFVGQPYAAYERDVDPTGRLTRLAFSEVIGQAY